MTWNKVWLPLAAAALVAASVFASCSSGGSGTVSLKARTGPVAAATDGGTASVDRGNGIALDRVRMVIRRLELDLTSTTDGGVPPGDGGVLDDGGKNAGDEAADDEAADVARGPFLIDLAGAALAGGIHPAFDTEVPAATYEKVCFVVNTVSMPMARKDAGLEAMKDLHASIVIEGEVDGAAFQFTTPFDVRQCRSGAFQVGSGTANLTFDVDYSGWFTGRGGERLDPRQPRDRGEILANIRCSIRLFPDGDMDGHPDDGDEGPDDEWRQGCPGLKPPPPDGGTPDGGTLDGGTPDGGAPDGGTPL